MSQPQPEKHTNGAPNTDPAQDEQQTSNREQAGQAHPPVRAVPSPGRNHHARQRAPRAVRPAPEPEKPATSKTDPRIVRQLTWDEIQYFIDHDMGKFFEEDFYRDMEFDRAIEAEPEIE
jgi:hypothetical protein